MRQLGKKRLHDAGMKRRDPWVALARAEKQGRGVCLTAHEVRLLINQDDAIISAAESYTAECVCDIMRFSVRCEYCTDKDTSNDCSNKP